MTGRSRLEVVLLLYRSNAVIIMQLRRMVLSVVALRERERDGAQYMVCVCVCVCGCIFFPNWIGGERARACISVSVSVSA